MDKRINQIGIMLLLVIIISCSKSENQAVNQLPNCLPTNLQNGLIAFYSFGNGSLNDSSGNNYNLSNSTSASSGMDRAGNTNCAFNFNGSDFLEYVNPTFMDDLPSTNMSISFWYKADDQDLGVFISRGDTNNCPSSYGQWSVSFTNASIEFAANGGYSSVGVVSTTWFHVVITSNNTLLQTYENGIFIGSQNNFSMCTSNNPNINQGNLFIGKLYDGLIDDVVIYNRILTSAEVTELYNLAPCCN